MILQSVTPYNIITGLDTNHDGVTAEQPALVSGATVGTCTGSNLVYRAGFGCFNLNPAPGTATIERNSARGPGSATLMLRLSRTWALGSKRETDPNAMGPPVGGPPPGGGGGGGPGGPPPGMGFNSGRRYTITLGVNAVNALNHSNFAPPSGDLSSPYFGESRSLAAGFGPIGAGSTYNRKVDVQLRFGF